MVLDLTRRLLPLLVLLLAASCGPIEMPDATATPIPTPDSLRVLVSPAFEPITGAVQTCARQVPNLALFVEQLPVRTQSPDITDIFIFSPLGEAVPEETFALGQERLVIIVHPKNDLGALSADAARAVFSGEIRTWRSLPGTGTSGPLRLYSFGPADPLQALFSSMLFETGSPSSPDNFLAPSPRAMREAVSADERAVGYLPEAWLDATVRAVDVEDTEAIRWQVPILAGLAEAPTDTAASLIGCLQSGEGQRLIQEIYPLSE